MHLAVPWDRGLEQLVIALENLSPLRAWGHRLYNILKISQFTKWDLYGKPLNRNRVARDVFPIKFEHYASRFLLFVDFLRYE